MTTNRTALKSSRCSILALPEELLEIILAHLDLRDLNAFCRTNWKCHRFTYARLYQGYTSKNKGHSCLSWAAAKGRTEVFLRAINEGVADCKFSHLVTACSHNLHTNLVRLLLDQESVIDGWHKFNSQADGANKVCRLYRSPLSAACDRDRYKSTSLVEETVDLLLAAQPSRQDLALIADSSRHVAICAAALHDRENIVRKLLAHGANVNARAYRGQTPISHALENGNKSMIDLLFDWGADPNILDNQGHPLLTCAASKGKEFVDRLLGRGVLVTQKSRDGKTAIFEAARGGHDELVNYLIDLGANPSARNDTGESVLFPAISYGNCSLPTVKRLTTLGNDVNWTTWTGATVLHSAIVTRAPVSHIDFLFQAGADPTIACNHRDGAGAYAIHHLPLGPWPKAPSLALQTLQIFHKHHADLNPPNTFARPCLVKKAIITQRTDILDFILDNSPHKLSFLPGGDIKHTHGTSALPAAHASTPLFLDWLIKQGMDNSRNVHGSPILHSLVLRSTPYWVVRYLVIEKGFDAHCVDNHARTLMHIAMDNRVHPQWIGVLAKLGVGMAERDEDGKTPEDLIVHDFCGLVPLRLRLLRRWMGKMRRAEMKILKGTRGRGGERDVWDTMHLLPLP